MKRIQPSNTVEAHTSFDGAVKIQSCCLQIGFSTFHILDTRDYSLKSGTHTYCAIHSKRRDTHAEELACDENITSRLDQGRLDPVLGQVQIRTDWRRLRRRWEALDFGGLPVCNDRPVRDCAIRAAFPLLAPPRLIA